VHHKLSRRASEKTLKPCGPGAGEIPGTWSIFLQETLYMRLVKLFKGVEAEVISLEAEINRWIKESGATVVRVTGNIAPQSLHAESEERLSGSDLFVIVEYEASVT
jgi:hypothetical protein